MNRIKDFFYDKNDIIVAVIILLAAAIIIYIRIDKIMAYPETLLNHSEVQQEQSAEDETVSDEEQAQDSLKSIQIANDPIPATVAKQLETAGIISSAADFEAALTKYKVTDRIQPGTYQIPVGMTNEQVIEVITGTKL